MLKRILLASVLILLISGMGFAFQNEPTGFRGLEWGDAPTKDMEHLEDIGNISVYVRPEDKMALGNVNLYLIAYSFYKNQFSGAALYFKGENNYDLMKTICKERFGEEEMVEKLYELSWFGQKGMVLLSYDPVEGEGFLALDSTVLARKREEAREEKETEEAEGDW